MNWQIRYRLRWTDSFLEAIKEVSARRMISTYYLIGEGFSGAESGKSWMNLSLKQLCAMKRHVFAGQNLYAEVPAIIVLIREALEENRDLLQRMPAC